MSHGLHKIAKDDNNCAEMPLNHLVREPSNFPNRDSQGLQELQNLIREDIPFADLLQIAEVDNHVVEGEQARDLPDDEAGFEDREVPDEE